MTSTRPAPDGAIGNTGEVDELDVLVVGAGFAGLYQLQRLRELGLSVKVYEAGSGLGGIWYWNCYPGARVDTHGPHYQFGHPDLWRGFDYDELYPGYDQVRAYFNHVDATFGLSRDIRYDTRVVGATFDESDHTWTVRTDTGRTARARFVVLCTGIGAKPIMPDIPGLGDFGGICHHSALWPQDGESIEGKRIGVIGTGATGVQLVQECAAVASRLTVFQRTPNLALPMRQRKLDDAAKAELRVDMDAQYAERADTFGGVEFDFIGETSAEIPEAELREIYEELWARGGFRFWLGSFFDVFTDEAINTRVYEFWRDKVRERIHDPVVAEKLAPTVPPHPFGVKRPSLEQNYYDVFNQDNVRLVDVNDTPIRRITENGVLTADGVEHELDVLILATGFDMVTGGLTQLDIRGTEGQTMAEQWAGGVAANFGTAMHGFPNLLFLYGPLSPAGFANGPTSAEVQGEEVIKLIDHMNRGGLTRVESTAEADAVWRDHTAEITDGTLFPRARSWYMGANIAGKAPQMLNYPGGLPQYRQKWAESRAAGYAGFEFA